MGDEATGSSSPRSRSELHIMPQNVDHLQELLRLGMAIRRTILGNVLLVLLHSLESGVKAMKNGNHCEGLPRRKPRQR